MNFRRSSLTVDEPEINLIPLIDILLVILIFLAATTSFQRYQQLTIALPQAGGEAISGEPLRLAVSSDGLYALDSRLIEGNAVTDSAAALQSASHGQQNPVLLINADAQAPHQAVINAMEAARQAGITRLNFATRQP